jgi:hypothetical protein
MHIHGLEEGEEMDPTQRYIESSQDAKRCVVDLM